MAVYVAVATAFAVGFALRAWSYRWWAAFAVSCLVVPVFILGVVLLQLDGWEWWSIALIFGGLYGAAAGGLGVLVAAVAKNGMEGLKGNPSIPRYENRYPRAITAYSNNSSLVRTFAEPVSPESGD